MKARIHRVVSSRSFTRLLSIAAVAVVAFAALELLIPQPAHAGIVCCTNSAFSDCICDSSTTCNITRNNKFYGTQVLGRTCWNYSSYGSASQIRSTIECEAVNGIGNSEFAESALLGVTVVEADRFTQSALLSCEVKDSPTHNDTAHFCQLDLSYSRPAGLTQCDNDSVNGTSTLTHAAFCNQVGSGNAQNRLTVTGTLRCGDTLNPGDLPAWCDGNPECILNLGIADTQGKCDDLFPAVDGSAAGQVLSLSQTVEGPNCGTESQVIAIDGPRTRYCSGGTFDGAAVDCISGSGRTQQHLTGIAVTESAVQFDVSFGPPNVFNVTCNPQNNDFWRFTIFGNQHLDVTLIDQSTLAVEGVQSVTCDAAVNNNLPCRIQACPNLGTIVGAERDPVTKEANLTVTGSLTSGTAIIGEQLVTTSP